MEALRTISLINQLWYKEGLQCSFFKLIIFLKGRNIVVMKKITSDSQTKKMRVKWDSLII